MSDQIEILSQKAQEYIKYDTPQKHTWCSGCGNFGILSAITRALVLNEIKPHECLICYDVGCNGNNSDKLNTYTIHGLHGRVTALAAGCHIGNHTLPIIATAGDGATFSEGINHLAHAIRNNYNVTFICHNNNNYGLTTGQASSTTPLHQRMNGTVSETVIEPLNTLQFVLSLNPSFVARGFAGDVEHLTSLIQQGINHKGFSYIEVFQACPTYNKATPQSWYFPRIKKIEEFTDYNNQDIWQARKIAENTEQDLAIGLLYHNPNKQDWYSLQPERKDTQTSLKDDVTTKDITAILQQFV